MPSDVHNQWLRTLSDEDVTFIKRFVLASGSLKQMAAIYGVSYPTVRLRLDRLIAKITVADSQDIDGHFERVLRTMHADGTVDMNALKALLKAHNQELEERDADARHNH